MDVEARINEILKMYGFPSEDNSMRLALHSLVYDAIAESARPNKRSEIMIKTLNNKIRCLESSLASSIELVGTLKEELAKRDHPAENQRQPHPLDYAEMKKKGWLSWLGF